VTPVNGYRRWAIIDRGIPIPLPADGDGLRALLSAKNDM
jgi:hypothetical protein